MISVVVDQASSRKIQSTRVQALIDSDRQITVTEIEQYFNDVACDPISHGTDDAVKAAVHEYFAKLDRNFSLTEFQN